MARDWQRGSARLEQTRIQVQQELMRLLASMPLESNRRSGVPRLDKIRRLQAAIAAGTYRIPAEVVAEKILQAALFHESEPQHGLRPVLTDSLPN